MSAEPPHVDVGAYALGLLEKPDRRAFEGHLRSCPGCHEELGALRGVAATLEGIAPAAAPATAPAPPDPAVVAGLLRRRARRGRRRRAARAVSGLAAGIALLGGAAGAGFTVGADRAGGPSAGPEAEALFRDGRRLSAADAGTGARGAVAVRSVRWGSQVGLRLTRVRGPLECELVAVDGAGRPHAVAGWSVPPGGYGLPGSAAPMLTVQGGTALRPGDIRRFEVRATGAGAKGGDRAVLTVPA